MRYLFKCSTYHKRDSLFWVNRGEVVGRDVDRRQGVVVGREGAVHGWGLSSRKEGSNS